MIVRTLFLVDMFFVLVLCPALLAAGVQTLTIDSQLGTSIEDCFERVTIGEQLPPSAIYRNVSELTTRECEQICKQDKQCQSYDYGVGAKGNATCNLGKFGDKELQETRLMRHPDYDVYIRRLNCEQGPPNPLPPPPQFDEPQGPIQDGPSHRPVFRPVDEEPKRPEDRPLSDDFIRPNDMRPYETNYRPLRPQFYNNYYDVPYNRPNRPYSPPGYRPQYPVNNHIDERPDDYGSQKPENDQNLGYGSHQPQVASFQPERPQRPSNNHNSSGSSPSRPKPGDPYDVLNFQSPYARPPLHDPGFWRPDPYFPSSPDDEVYDIYGPKPLKPNNHPVRPILDEKPNYHYIFRPSRKPAYQSPPNPQADFGYAPIKPYQDHRPNSGYGQNYPENPSDDFYDPYPSRPYDKPTYSYGSQYASNYGQNSNYNQGNDIHVEIYDPPRPYRPLKPFKKPLSDKPTPGYGQNDPDFDGYNKPPSQHSGYGSHDSHNSQIYNSHSSQSQYYGSNQYSHSSGYGQQDNNYNSGNSQGGYIKPLSDPIDHRPSKPSYGSQSSHSTSQYGSQNNYGSTSQRPQDKPQNNQGYGSQDNNPGYGSQSYHGSGNQGGYGSQNYGGTTQHTTSSLNTYSNHHNSGYGSNHVDSSYDRPDQPYGNDPSGSDDDGYKNSDNVKPGSITKRPSYDNKKPGYDNKRPGYDNERPGYDKKRPGYDNERPGYDNKIPYYDNKKPGYDNERPGYDNKRPDNDKNRPAYGQLPNSTTSGYDRPSRPDVRPVYEHGFERPTGVPSYVVRPDGQIVTSRPVAISDVMGRRPGGSRDPGHEFSYKDLIT